jgi:hypothetical protein
MVARPRYQQEPIELRDPIWEAGHISVPVIDRWTVKAVYGTAPGNFQRSRVYADFARHLVQHASHYSTAENIHQVDQEIMNAAMTCRHEPPCDCLPFAPVAMPD